MTIWTLPTLEIDEELTFFPTFTTGNAPVLPPGASADLSGAFSAVELRKVFKYKNNNEPGLPDEIAVVSKDEFKLNQDISIGNAVVSSGNILEGAEDQTLKHDHIRHVLKELLGTANPNIIDNETEMRSVFGVGFDSTWETKSQQRIIDNSQVCIDQLIQSARHTDAGLAKLRDAPPDEPVIDDESPIYSIPFETGDELRIPLTFVGIENLSIINSTIGPTLIAERTYNITYTLTT